MKRRRNPASDPYNSAPVRRPARDPWGGEPVKKDRRQKNPQVLIVDRRGGRVVGQRVRNPIEIMPAALEKVSVPQSEINRSTCHGGCNGFGNRYGCLKLRVEWGQIG